MVTDLIGNMLSGLSYGRMLGRLAAVFIWGVGIIAALNQIGVATSVTTPILITVLATIGGILVVGIGGGLIRPMQQRWEGWLDTVEGEMPQLRGHAEAYQRGREDAARQREGVATRQQEWAGAPRTGDQWSPQTSGAGYRPETGGMTEPGYGGQSGQGYGQGYGEAPGYDDPQSPR
ncbi:hypothetical protein [Nocardia wallacei]|uniref:hypothetical protein n=1 Tax=Nocardia wallacei TaxID=480035 RepID=UPI00313C7437